MFEFRKLRRRVRHVQSLLRHRKTIKQLVNRHLLFLENQHLSLWGSLTEEDEQALAEAVRRASEHPGPIVEVGTLFGWTTQLLASLKPTDKELVTIDNFSWNPFALSPADQQKIVERTLRYPIDHCHTRIFVGTSADFYRQYQGPPPSMVFIDADHSFQAVSDDIAWALQVGVPIITGHDYNDMHAGVKQAVAHHFPTGIECRGSVWMADGRGTAKSAA